MELIILLIVACLGCFLFVFRQIFPRTIGKDGADLGYSKRLWIIVNLFVWAYECFFLIAVCGGIKGMNVFFGGGLGDLLYLFLLVGMVLLHIVLLAVFIQKKLRTVFYIILVCLPIYPLVIMHSAAARGNEENGPEGILPVYTIIMKPINSVRNAKRNLEKLKKRSPILQNSNRCYTQPKMVIHDLVMSWQHVINSVLVLSRTIHWLSSGFVLRQRVML